jgi:hypothetical protein
MVPTMQSLSYVKPSPPLPHHHSSLGNNKGGTGYSINI